MSDGPAVVIVDSTGANIAAVKGASTAAVAADKALVVVVSPNNSVAITAASLPLPTGAATESTLATRASEATVLTLLTEAEFEARVGEVQATPTAYTILGRLKALMDDFTSLLSRIPAALIGGRFDTNIGSWLGSTTPTVGQKAMAASLPVSLASDQSTILTHDEYALTAYHNSELWSSESETQTLLSNVSGKSLILRSVVCSSTGNGRFEVKIGTAGSEVTTHVVYTSEANPTLELDFFGRSVPNGQQVIVIKTSQDRYPKALDYHTTIAHHFA